MEITFLSKLVLMQTKLSIKHAQICSQVLTCGLSFPLVLLLDVLKHVFFFYYFLSFYGPKDWSFNNSLKIYIQNLYMGHQRFKREQTWQGMDLLTVVFSLTLYVIIIQSVFIIYKGIKGSPMWSCRMAISRILCLCFSSTSFWPVTTQKYV